MKSNSKVVIVTGAGNGIGREIAYAYAQKKYIVVAADINEDSLTLLQQQWSKQNLEVIYYHIDVKNELQIMQLFEEVYTKYGRIDILINNAGISRFKKLQELSVAEFDEIYQTNLRSCFITSREFSKYNNGKEYGRIINISSTRYLMSEVNSEAYAASKGGIVSLTHALAASLSNNNLTVNAISPGWIHNGNEDSLILADHEQHFSKRVGKSSDIVQACFYLTEENNNFITGQNIIIDGGMTKKMIYV